MFFTIGKVVKVRNVSEMKMSEEQRARYYSAKYPTSVKYNRCYCKLCFVGVLQSNTAKHLKTKHQQVSE